MFSREFMFIYLLSFLEREEVGRERDINLLFHLFMHSLATSYMCPDWGSNLQPWYTGTAL